MSVIITSPHAKCPTNIKTRMCDLAASLSGKLFFELCITHKINAIYLEGDEYRYNHDLNRKNSRKTNFRKRLQKFLSGNPKPLIVIDIHSFPDYRIEEAGDINFFKNGEKPPDVVLLRGPLDIKTCNGIRKSICQELYLCVKNKYNCKIIDNITVNDILNNSSEHNIPGILIEINEKFVNDSKRLEYILSDLINQIKTML